ncbi:MAG: 3'-5' exonuclease [Lachnospiraceae bacterium]|nr:3'-5' exonuclease [Lachnospiraceae bacterium]
MLENYVVIDLEMTGLSAKTDKIIEIGAVRVRGGKQKAQLELLVNPKCNIPEKVTELTGITNEMVENGMDMDEAVEKLLVFIGDDVIIGQNVQFDYSFLKQWAVNHKYPLELQACDTLKIARVLLPKEQPKKLENLCEYFQIERARAHRALDDAIEAMFVFEKLKELGKDHLEREKIFAPKVLMYKAKRQTPVTIHQLKRLKEYREQHQITDEINWENLTRNEASRIMDRYYATYGR